MADAPSPDSAGRKGLPPIVAIFLTVFIDLLSFGMFIPDIQLRGKDLVTAMLGTDQGVQHGLYIGIALSSFSVAQLLTAPYLGRLSDRVGRRKILLITTLLSIISYLVYAHATSYPMLLVSRVLSGIAAANLGVAFAYIADVTTPENRAKGLGLVGAAFGLGFIFGPAIGAAIMTFSHNDPLPLGYAGALFGLVNLIFIARILPESLKPENARRSKGLLKNLGTAMRTPGLGLMLVMFFVLNYGFTNLETTFFQLMADPRSIFAIQGTPAEIERQARINGSIVLLAVGVISAFMQGYLIRKVQPIYGEVRLLRFAYLLVPIGLVLVPHMPLWIPALVAILFLGVGTGLAQPSLSSLISRAAPVTMQGSIFGVTQALGALARAVSPLTSNTLFKLDPHYPYYLGAILVLFPMVAAWRLKQPEGGGGEEAVPAH